MPAYVPPPAGPCPCRSGAVYGDCCARDAARIERAMRLCDEDRAEEALAILGGDAVEILGRRAIVLRMLGRVDESERLVAAALARNPDYPRGLYLRASSLLERGDFRGAARDFERCEKLLPHDDFGRRAEAYTNLGVALYNAGDVSGAREAWRGAITVEPDNEFARMNLLRLADDGAGGRDRVASEFAVEEPGDTLALENDRRAARLFAEAVELQRSGRVDEAIPLYEEVFDLDPTSADACLNLGYAHDEIGDLRTARDWFERFLSLEPRSAEAERVKKVLARMKKRPRPT